MPLFSRIKRAAKILVYLKDQGSLRKNSLIDNIFEPVLKAVLYDADDFFFVQVGGNDGKTNDYLYPLIQKYQLSGMIFEPQRAAFEKLRTAHVNSQNITLVNAAISNNPNDTLDMYSIAEPYNRRKDGREIPDSIASLDPEGPFTYARKHSKYRIGRRDKDKVLEVQNVQNMRFAEIIHQWQLYSIDMLFVDAEGADAIIVREALKECRPRLINYEHKNLPRQERFGLWKTLGDMGYRLLTHRPDRGDTCALMRE